MAYDLQAQFSVNETVARAWLTSVVENDGLDPANSSYVGIDAEWRPIDGESDCLRLVDQAHAAGAIVAPNGMNVSFLYEGDEDGGTYSYLLEFGADLCVTEYAQEMRKIGSFEVAGAEAALGILEEAVAYANSMLGRVAVFVAANAKVSVLVPLSGGDVAAIEVEGVLPENVTAELYDFDFTGADESEYTTLTDGSRVYVDRLAVNPVSTLTLPSQEA